MLNSEIVKLKRDEVRGRNTERERVNQDNGRPHQRGAWSRLKYVVVYKLDILIKGDIYRQRYQHTYTIQINRTRIYSVIIFGTHSH